MGLVLDPSVLIAAEKEVFDLPSFLKAETPTDTVFITSVTASELLHGVHRADGKRKLKRQIFVKEILRNLPDLPFDLPSTRTHSRIWADLQKQGIMIGSHDLMISAICLTQDHTLATLNKDEFQRVEGLRLANTSKYQNTF